MKKLLLTSALAFAAMSLTVASATAEVRNLIVVGHADDVGNVEVIQDGFKSFLACNNFAISQLDKREAWCEALDAKGNPVVFEQRPVKYVYPNYKAKSHRIIEIRRR